MVSNQRVVPASSNVYTVLALIATLALAFGTIFVAMRNIELTRDVQPNNGSNPWYVHPQSADQQSASASEG